MSTTATPIKFSRLKQTHPRLNLGRVRTLHALYRGGQHLLGDPAVMDAVFGKIGDEHEIVYSERKRRAFYENLFAVVVNQISAGLAQDPAHIVTDAAEVDSYWTDMMKNATVIDDEGINERSFDQVMRDTCVEALVCGWSWLQADLPTNDATEIVSLADQESSGGLRAYLCAWPTDCITDWEEKNGKLLWLRTYERIVESPTPSSDRDTIVHRWTIWDDQGWQRYEVVESTSNTDPKPLPADEVMIEPGESGTHSFERVPWIRLDLCHSGSYLHVGDLIESLCRVYFNRTNGESWQWTQNAFQQLYEFLDAEVAGVDTEISAAQQNPARAIKQRRAPGVVHVRGAGDKAMYVSPNMSGADIGAKATQDLRDAIFRVTAQMALSQDTSGAMLRRSADSKKQDSVAQEIVLGAIGKRLLVAATTAIKLLGCARQEEDPPQIDGYQRFDVDDTADLINQTVMLDVVSIPSATYQVEQKFRVAAAHLGDNTDPEILDKIRKELEGAITQDQLEAPPPVMMKGDPTDDSTDEADPEVNPEANPLMRGKSDGTAKPAPGHQEKLWSCGPASLVNVCAALGIDVDEAEVRKHSEADKNGTSEEQLMDAADALDLSYTEHHDGDENASWDELTAAVASGQPCIICTQEWDHWCAVIGVVGEKVVMLDSANTKDNIAQNGVHVLTKEDLIRIWKCREVEKSFYFIAFEEKWETE